MRQLRPEPDRRYAEGGIDALGKRRRGVPGRVKAETIEGRDVVVCGRPSGAAMTEGRLAVLSTPDIVRHAGTMPHAETADMVGELLETASSDPGAVRRVVDVSAGNPYFDSKGIWSGQ